MSFTFELISPERLLLAGNATAVIVPGSEGEFTVLEDHAPLMSTLKPGIVTVQTEDAETRLFVRGGFANVAPNSLTILAEQPVLIEEFDSAQFEAAVRDAEQDIAEAGSDEARRVANERLSRLIELREVLAL